MSVVQDSPTKQICEKLQGLKLNESSDNAVKQQSHLGSFKNHLQVPKLVVNHEFEADADTTTATSDQWDEQATVLHHKDDPNTTLPDWMKVKLEMNQQKSKETESSSESTKVASYPFAKPKLVSSTADFDIQNTTWENLKKQYDIKDQDLYADDEEEEEQDLHNNSDETNLSQLMNQSVYSFQEMPKLRVATQPSTIHTAKVTSFKSEVVDSPMAPPKLLRAVKLNVIEPSLSFTQPKIPLKLITPTDLSMIFDDKEGKWVLPREPENKTSNENSTNEVTSVSNLDMSFSISKRALISALTDVLKPNSNWDQIFEVDISNKNLITMTGIEEFTPNLKKINISNNQLTNTEGLSSSLQSINLSKNSVCDHLTDFSKFKNLLTLDLSNNKISDMEIFKELICLRELNLSNNKVKKIVDLPSLMKLNLSNNRIEGVLDFTNYEFSWLWDLDLSKNSIKQIKNFGLKEILSLSLKNNRLDSFEIKSSLKLKKLELNNNDKLIEFKPLDKLNSLTILSFDGNTKITGSFPNLTSLKLLKDINQERLKDDKNFKVNQHLLNLTYTESQFTSKNYNLMQKRFPHLQNLDLSSNLINDTFISLLEFLKFYKLDTIKLDSNPFLGHLKTEQDKLEFRIMLQKIINDE